MNIIFFNKEGYPYNFQYNEEKWEGKIYFDENSSDTFKTIGLYIFEKVLPINFEDTFNMKELLYRVKAILRRTKCIEHERIAARDIVMDFNTRKTFIAENEVVLTKLEFELLCLFITNKNRALDRAYLLEKLWGNSEEVQKRTVNVTINRLKKKIDPEDVKEYIVPVRGIGYKFS